MKISVLSDPEAGAARPRAFHLGVRRVPVAAILEKWEAGGYRYFQVVDFHGRRFVLRHCASGEWELEGVCGPAPKVAKGARAAA